MSTASTTMYTYLGYAQVPTSSSTTVTYAKLCPIKDYPDLGGEPDQVEITDLDDDVQKFLLGVQSMSSLPFTANYDPDTFKTLNTMADGTVYEFCVSFGKKDDPDAYGAFTWKGQLSVYATGGSVNSPREMRISISALTKVQFSESITITVS